MDRHWHLRRRVPAARPDPAGRDLMRARTVVMNGTRRPVGMWCLAGVGPLEWVISHRPFLRAMGAEQFDSIYTPRRWRRRPRKIIPGLDYWWRQFRTEPLEDDF